MLAVFNKAQSTLDNKAEPILARHDRYEQEFEVVKLTCKISKTLYKKDGGFKVLPHGLKPIPTGLSFEQYGGLSMNSQKRRESAAKCWHTASSTLRAPFSISIADKSKRPCVHHGKFLSYLIAIQGPCAALGRTSFHLGTAVSALIPSRSRAAFRVCEATISELRLLLPMFLPCTNVAKGTRIGFSILAEAPIEKSQGFGPRLASQIEWPAESPADSSVLRPP